LDAAESSAVLCRQSSGAVFFIVSDRIWTEEAARVIARQNVFVRDLEDFHFLHFEIPRKRGKRIVWWISSEFLQTASVAISLFSQLPFETPGVAAMERC
jgi:hypothetical protein